MAYRNFKKIYRCMAEIETPAVAELFISKGTIKEVVDEIDTTETGMLDEDEEFGFSDVEDGVATLEYNLTVQHRASGTLIDTFKPGKDLAGLNIYVDRAQDPAWGMTNGKVLSAEHPIEVRKGVWQTNVVIKSRGSFTRPSATT